MSTSARELAYIELLQSARDGESFERRRALYDEFGKEGEPWIPKARRAYAEMSTEEGVVGAIGDQLLSVIDILEHAEVFAAVGGFETEAVTEGAGYWWNPMARWHLLASDQSLTERMLDDRFTREVWVPRLLDEGAHALAQFYATVVQGGEELLARRGSRQAMPTIDRGLVVLVTEVSRQRGLYFRDGPLDNGRYLPGSYERDLESSETTVVRALRALGIPGSGEAPARGSTIEGSESPPSPRSKSGPSRRARQRFVAGKLGKRKDPESEERNDTTPKFDPSLKGGMDLEVAGDEAVEYDE